MSATATVNLAEIASKWRLARRLYPFCSEVNRRFALGMEPCRDLEIPINRSEPGILDAIANWFDRFDDLAEVWQMRQVLQTTHLVDADGLRALLQRQLQKGDKTARVRDKVDYLLVQYYAQCAPGDAHNNAITFEHVAEVLDHVLGQMSGTIPAIARELDDILTDLASCVSLGNLLSKKILDRARETKNNAGHAYFDPAVLVVFARFNFLLRMAFFRLMHADLHAIRLALHHMESRGQSVCDCSEAGLSTMEPLVNLRAICHEWKKPFRAAYSAGSNFQQLVAIRAAVEVAVAAPLPAEVAGAVGRAVTSSTEIPAVSADPEKPTIESYIAEIMQQLSVNAPATGGVSNLSMGGSKLLLASWEVAAYITGTDEIAIALRRTVAARALLSVTLEMRRSNESVDLSGAIAVAHAEAAAMQEQIAKAKDVRNIDAAVNLAATQKRLLGLVQEAEKLNAVEEAS
jgi:hypothetical protein